MNDQLGSVVIEGLRREYANQRKLAEKAIAQLKDDQMFGIIDDEANSVAVIMKHVGGNLRSRRTDFLTTDGEKPDRKRDEEFVASRDTRASVTAMWERGWGALDATLETLHPEDLVKPVSVRGEALPAIQQIHRNLAHTAQHCGQIIL